MKNLILPMLVLLFCASNAMAQEPPAPPIPPGEPTVGAWTPWTDTGEVDEDGNIVTPHLSCVLDNGYQPPNTAQVQADYQADYELPVGPNSYYEWVWRVKPGGQVVHNWTYINLIDKWLCTIEGYQFRYRIVTLHPGD